MGIWNRDYMKRPPDEDGDESRGATDSGSKLEAFFSGFLERHPKFFVYVGIGLAALVVVALAVAKFSKPQ